MKRQQILAIVFAVLLAVLAALYFIIVKPFTLSDEAAAETTAPETEEGEALGLNNRIFMFTSIEATDIASIQIDNGNGGFAFDKNSDGEYRIRNFEDIPYSSELFAKLVNVTSYTLSKTKVMSNAPDNKIEEYGLANPQASWTIKDKSGNYFRVLVGDKLLTGGGYYCMLDGRETVYVLSEDIATTVLVPIETYVTPVLCTGMSKDDFYNVDKFTVYKDGEKLLRIRQVAKEDQRNKEALAESILDYPTAYYPNSTNYYDFLKNAVNLMATSCYKISATDADFAMTGLDNPAHVITFDYKKMHFEMYFSALQDGEFYYARSNLYPNVIAKCTAADYEQVGYNLLDWIDKYVFQQYITNISQLSITTDKVEASFKLKHGTDDEGNTTLTVNADGTVLATGYENNFREYYKSLLALTAQDYYYNDEYCNMTKEEMEAFIADDKNVHMTFVYKELDGTETTIKTYRYSTRHSVITINGVGEFYVLTDLIDKIENDTIRVKNGEDVTAFTKN